MLIKYGNIVLVQISQMPDEVQWYWTPHCKLEQQISISSMRFSFKYGNIVFQSNTHGTQMKNVHLCSNKFTLQFQVDQVFCCL